jgi:hypothetical protein
LTVRCRLVVGMALLLIAGCGVGREPEPVRLQVGVHEISLQVPDGWVHLDYGSRHLLERDLLRISIFDHGPVSREGYLRELRHAHQLVRAGRPEDAQAHLAGLDLRPSLTSERQWQRFRDAWWVALDGGRSTDRSWAEAEHAWSEILDQVERLGPPDLDVIVRRVVPEIDATAHRELAGLEPSPVGELPGRRVLTWDRLSHARRRSFLMVLDHGNLLVLGMQLGAFAELQPTFEALAASLQVYRSPAAS